MRDFHINAARVCKPVERRRIDNNCNYSSVRELLSKVQVHAQETAI